MIVILGQNSSPSGKEILCLDWRVYLGYFISTLVQMYTFLMDLQLL